MKKVPFLIDLIATGFFTGKAPFMPGTFGSLVAIPLGYAASFFALPIKAAMFLAVFFMGVFVSGRFEYFFGSKDPSCVVIDEIAALFLLYIIFPFTPLYIVCGFIFFRIFDIMKPIPIHYLENFPGGWGIMADDIGAALYASAVCFIIKIISETV